MATAEAMLDAPSPLFFLQKSLFVYVPEAPKKVEYLISNFTPTKLQELTQIARIDIKMSSKDD